VKLVAMGQTRFECGRRIGSQRGAARGNGQVPGRDRLQVRRDVRGDATAIARNGNHHFPAPRAQPIVVVSALGGATNQLIQIAEQAAKGSSLVRCAPSSPPRSHMEQAEALVGR